MHARVSKEAAAIAFRDIKRRYKARVSSKGVPRGKAVGIRLWEFQEGKAWTPVASFKLGQSVVIRQEGTRVNVK